MADHIIQLNSGEFVCNGDDIVLWNVFKENKNTMTDLMWRKLPETIITTKLSISSEEPLKRSEVAWLIYVQILYFWYCLKIGYWCDELLIHFILLLKVIGAQLNISHPYHYALLNHCVVIGLGYFLIKLLLLFKRFLNEEEENG